MVPQPAFVAGTSEFEGSAVGVQLGVGSGCELFPPRSELIVWPGPAVQPGCPPSRLLAQAPFVLRGWLLGPAGAVSGVWELLGRSGPHAAKCTGLAGARRQL